MTAAQITRSLEEYHMWLLGKTMFTDNHGNTISARYIPIAQEIAEATEAEHITQRSWGSAVLAATYRGMCKGCQLTSQGSGIVGCPLLLQLWSWARFPIGRPEIGGGSWLTDEMYDSRIVLPQKRNCCNKVCYCNNHVGSCHMFYRGNTHLMPQFALWR